MVLGVEIAVIVIAVLYCFLGYRLARILLPICGAAITFVLLYFSFLQSTNLIDIEIFIISASAAVFAYVILFYIKRAAAFVVGLVAAAFACLIVLSLFDFGSLDIVSPIVVALCLMSALLSFVYLRIAVIVTTSLLGGCVASITGVMLLTMGGAPQSLGLLIPSAVDSIITNTFMTAFAALGFTAIAILVQFLVFSSKTLLPTKSERRKKNKQLRMQNEMQNEKTDIKRGRNSFI